MAPPSSQVCEDETVRIHSFFVNWLNGTVRNANEIFEKNVTAVLATDFVLVKTNGTVVKREALQKELRKAHGIKKGLFFNMEIHNFEILQSHNDWCLCTYQEWHYGLTDNAKQEEEQQEAKSLLNEKRQCTAMFRNKPNTPHGIEWVHIHETTIKE